jgi:hypothetical protein
MPSRKFLTVFLTLSLCGLGVSSCNSTASALQTYPRASLLAQQPAPAPTPDIVTSAQANARYQRAKDEWGQAGWNTVHAICVWAKERGMKDAPC